VPLSDDSKPGESGVQDNTGGSGVQDMTETAVGEDDTTETAVGEDDTTETAVEDMTIVGFLDIVALVAF
jgi:hypothetical protein